MGALIKHEQPIAKAEDLTVFLKDRLPQYKVSKYMSVVIVKGGQVAGLGVKLKGRGQVKTYWVIPAVWVRLVMMGLLPLLVMWLTVGSKVKQMESEVRAALEGAAPPAGG